MPHIKKSEELERLSKMTHQILADQDFQKMLAKKATIYSPVSQQHENCLWINGSGLHSSERSMFIHIEYEGFDALKISVTITDDESGRTNYLLWGYGNDLDKASMAMLMSFLIQDVIDGNGERVAVR